MAHRREKLRCLQELGLGESASEDDIKRAYRAAAFKYHPDKNPGVDTTSKFQKIAAAYKYLIEGDAFLIRIREDQESAEFSILRFFFPWLFQPQFHFRSSRQDYGYYDDSDDDSDDDYVPRGTHTTQEASGASHYYNKNTNFTHTSAQHGQFFQDKKTKKKAAKKRYKEAKRDMKLAADKERSQAAKTSTSDAKTQNRGDGSKSPTPNLSGKQQTREANNSQPGTEKEKPQATEKNNSTNSTEASKNSTEDQSNKKSKKQILMEQKQKEKELKEINEELMKQEKERKEKLEKKRAAQEEKDRQEREAREKEEQEREEEERKQAEELRKLLEEKEEEKKRKKREAARMKKLLEDFDSGTFLDENGDFKYTDPEVKNIIRRDDINHLGNASKNVPQQRLETINGLKTESLIKIQERQQMEDKSKSRQEQVLGSPNHAKLGPIGSQPQNQYTNHKMPSGQQYNNNQTNQHRDYQRQSQHPQQQHQPPREQQYPQQQPQHFNHPPPLRPTFPMPYWSHAHPPPPLHNINTNVPRPSGRFNNGYSDKRFPNNGVYTRTFSSRGFHGKV